MCDVILRSMAVRAPRKSLTEQVADGIVRHIVEAALREGDPLPTTAALIDEYNVSRTVVREALADLAGRGLVRRSPGREFVVGTPGADALSDLIGYQVQREQLTVMHVQEIREAIEVKAASL